MFRFTNEIGNRGNGPLEIQPSAESLDCDGDGDPANDRDATQRVFADSNGTGLFERGTDGVAAERRFGCMRYHPAHDHWHVLDIATYELRREPATSAQCAARARSASASPTPGWRSPTPTSQLTSTYPVNPPGRHQLPVGDHAGDLIRAGRTPTRSRFPARRSTSPACRTAATA